MQKVIEYENWSTTIFEGFYESGLYSSDSLINHPYIYDITPPDGYEFDLYNFQGFMNEVGQEAVHLIWNNVPDEDGIILDMKFVGISSPRFYNFSTDRICAEIKVDYEKLKDYCLISNRDKFDDYLRENFSDRDGFWSFVANNVKDFESELETESKKYDNVMVEYYLLNLPYMQERPYDLSEYDSDLYEKAMYIMGDYICLYKAGKYYSYTYENEDKIVVGEEMPKLDN